MRTNNKRMYSGCRYSLYSVDKINVLTQNSWSGISGLCAAFYLNDVTGAPINLYESSDRLGGHSHNQR